VDATVSAAASAIVAKATGEIAARTGTTNRDTLERTFDPLWTNAIDLLNLLESRRLVKRGLDEAVGLGSFVLISGELLLIDTANAKANLAVPEIKSHVLKTMAD